MAAAQYLVETVWAASTAEKAAQACSKTSTEQRFDGNPNATLHVTWYVSPWGDCRA